MKIEFCLLDADYIIEDKPVIRLFGVDEKGRSVKVLDRSFSPYFYVTKKIKKIPMITSMENAKKINGLKEVKLTKVNVDLPQNIQKVREKIKDNVDCYEYSVNFYKRYIIDKKFYPLSWLVVEGTEISQKNYGTVIEAEKITLSSKQTRPKLKILAFDIETVDSKIVMVSIADNRGFRKIIYDIPEFCNVIEERDPDIILTYNGDAFDFEIISKIQKKGLGREDIVKFEKRAYMTSARLSGRIHIDLFNFVNNILGQQIQSEILTLNEVSRELIGEGKDELSIEEIKRLWESDKPKLAEYCQHDSDLTLKLGDFLLPQIFEMSKISGQLPFDCSRLTYGLLVEWFLMRKAVEGGILIPNPPHWKEIQERRTTTYKGGYVKEPVQGIHKNIAVFDFRSLYPSIIVTYNISPETLNIGKDCFEVPETKYRFCKKPEGFIPRNLRKIVEERMRLKNTPEKERQGALKILANATYGYMAYPGARWYSHECAESAAAFGRSSIINAINEAEKAGLAVLYSDTDSLFVKGGDIKKVENFLYTLNKSLTGIMELDLQGYYKSGIFVPQRLGNYTAKKRYALINSKGDITVRGLETVRRDWCNIARKLQHDIIRFVLTDKEEEAVNAVRKTIVRVRNRDVTLQEITIRTQLGKRLEDYKSIGPHVAVAKRLQQAGIPVYEGTLINYIITKSGKSISERARPITTAKISDYDIDYYLNHQIIPVALRVLCVLGYKEEDFKNGLKRFV